MSGERPAMRHVRDVIRVKWVGLPDHEIARRVGAAASTVRLTLQRVEAPGLVWPLPDELTDTALEARLFANAGGNLGRRRHEEPDWADVHVEISA
jgi:hypothetical protein